MVISSNLQTHKSEYEQHQQLNQSSTGFHNNNNNNSTESQTLHLLRDVVDSKNSNSEQQQQHLGPSSMGNYDGQSLEGNLENEIKSISSMKSGGSNSQER